MPISKRVVYFVCGIAVVLSAVVLLCGRSPKRKNRPVDIFIPYYTPEGTPVVGRDLPDYFKFEWGDRESVRQNLKSAPKVDVSYAVTPDIFQFLQNCNKLEILSLTVQEPTKPCDLTGIESIPALRTLELSLHSDLHKLADCRSLAKCKTLKCIRVGGVRFSVDDMKEIARSGSVKILGLDMYCDLDPGAISELRHLSTLKTVWSEVGSARLLSELSEITSLEQIAIGFDTLDALDALDELRKLPNLKYLSICVKEEQRDFVRATLPNVDLHLFNDVR
jgi:hypothetical protein